VSTDRAEFRVEPQAEGRFAVISAGAEICFVGTLAECSEWLDANEVRCPNPEPARPDLLDPNGVAGR
jgi:hypothetical protein